MADSFVTPSSITSSKPLLLFLEALLLGKAAQTLLLTGKYSKPFLLAKGSLLGEFPSVSFVVDMARCRDAFFAYLNGADS